MRFVYDADWVLTPFSVVTRSDAPVQSSAAKLTLLDVTECWQPDTLRQLMQNKSFHPEHLEDEIR